MKGHNSRLSVHHIGGRVGNRAFPYLKKFEEYVINVLYDADPDCLDQILEANKHLPSELHVLPYCLADCRKTVSFNINFDPFTSSLYESNPEYGSFTSFQGDHDYIWSEATKTMEKLEVNVVTLDHLFKPMTMSIPPPDLLSLDVQGAEYDILIGAQELLRDDILSIVAEVEFHPLYSGQKLFGDISKLLSDQGFDFAQFLNIHEYSPYRVPIGLRGDGFQIHADALFFKKVKTINRVEDVVVRNIMFEKLAFIGIVYNQFEIALECLRLRKSLVSDYPQLRKTYFSQFLEEFEIRAENILGISLQSFDQKYTFETSKSRFDSGTSVQWRTGLEKEENIGPKEKAGILKTILRGLPAVYPIMMFAKRFLQSIMDSLSFLGFHASRKNIRSEYTEIEKLLCDYSLIAQAEKLKEKRLLQSSTLSLSIKKS